MKRIGVLKDVAYGLKTGGGTTANLSEAELLAPGAWGVYNPVSGTLLAANAGNQVAALSDDLQDSKTVMFAFGRVDGTLLVEVPRSLRSVNRMDGKAFTKPIITIGGTTANQSFPFENEGDAWVKVADTTYSSRFGIPSIRANVYKTASMTPEQMVDKMVEKLNASTMFGGVTATKVKDVGDQYFGITITPKDERVQIEVAVGGMWQGSRNEQTTDPVYGIGSGVDIAKIEKECNVFGEGDGNYIDYQKEFFNGTLETDTSDIYDVFTLTYDGYHQGATTKRHAMRKELQIATIDGASTMTPAAIETVLNAVFPVFGDILTRVDALENP